MDANLKKKVTNRILQVLFLLLIQAGILFFVSGQFDWLWAWLFLGIYIIAIALIGSYLFSASPETIARRSEAGNAQPWDRLVGGLWSLVYFIAIPLVAALNERYAWTLELRPIWHVLGMLLFGAGIALFGGSMIANMHFSTVVRVVSGGQHIVCDRGPYSIVRHPGYLGLILQMIGIPLILGSPWALIAAAVGTALMVIRTALEDRFLHQRLAGYPQYAARVRHRLLPGIW